jgi:hypothetical protein
MTALSPPGSGIGRDELLTLRYESALLGKVLTTLHQCDPKAALAALAAAPPLLLGQTSSLHPSGSAPNRVIRLPDDRTPLSSVSMSVGLRNA